MITKERFINKNLFSISMTLASLRKRINDAANNIGEKLTPEPLKERYGGKHLGDLLTADLNSPSRKGAAAGLIFNGVTTYTILSDMFPQYDISQNPDTLRQLEELALTGASYLNPLTLPVLGAYVAMDWGIGKLIEKGRI